MDAEKNVVEAARRVIAWAGRRWPTVFDPLREAIAAYDSAPAPSEDRVREAAGRCVRALLMDSRCTEGDRLAIKKRGSDGNEHDLGAWSHDAALNVIAEALRPYVTPAPALPAGTVAVSVETLLDIKNAFLYAAQNSSGAVLVHCQEWRRSVAALIPPPPRPEPPKELVAEWERKAVDAATQHGTPFRSAFSVGYVAALRAAWEAEKWGA